jgi:hypothetical protein
MKNSTRLLTLLTMVIAALFLFGTAYAGSEDAPRKGFVDLDGDGINDNMKDGDGDGIPNFIDGDYLKSLDGSAYMNAYQTKEQFKEQVREKAQLTFHWRTHERSKELFQNQYGVLGEGSQSGQMNENANKGADNAGQNGGK